MFILVAHLPFTHKAGTAAQTVVGSREEAISKFEEYLRSNDFLMKAVKRELKGKILGCWRSPSARHGDGLVKIANEE